MGSVSKVLFLLGKRSFSRLVINALLAWAYAMGAIVLIKNVIQWFL